MKADYRRPRRAQLFWVLMVLALLLSFAPAGWSRWMSGFLQPLGWVQWISLSTLRLLGRSAADLTGGDVERAALRDQVTLLETQILHQQAQLLRQQEQLETLSAIRTAVNDARARILRARVVAFDPSPVRSSLRISRGARDDVRVGDWVVACAATSAGQAGPASSPLLTSWVVGRVREVQPLVSVVQGAADPGFGPVRVRVAGRDGEGGGGWRMAPAESLLQGAGRGLSRIAEATLDYSEAGFDTVLVNVGGRPETLLAVGRVTASESVPNAPLHYNLTVRPWADARQASDVFVLQLERD